MRLTVLGSAAAEGWPALFCRCEACARARELGGRDLRHRTSYRVGEWLQVDWGPDTYAASLAFGMDTSLVTDLLVTHSHEDHFTPHELFYRRPGFSQVPENERLRIHGPIGVQQALPTDVEDLERYRLSFARLRPYDTRELPEGLSVTAIPAAHADPSAEALNYILTAQGRCLLIGNDTGWWDDPVWDFLAGMELHVVIMDCTYGPRRQRHGHLGVHEVVEAKQQLEAIGALADGCRFIANHFSHNGGWLYADLVRFFAPHHIEVAFDGMVVEW